MSKYFSVLAILVACTFMFSSACKNGKQNAPSEQEAPAPANSKRKLTMPGEAPPSDADELGDMPPNKPNPMFPPAAKAEKYKGILKGKWVNLADTKKALQITDTEFRVYENSKFISSSPFSISLDCDSEICRAANSANSGGWCLSTETDCFVVTKADLLRLQYFKLGTADSYAYQRIKE